MTSHPFASSNYSGKDCQSVDSITQSAKVSEGKEEEEWVKVGAEEEGDEKERDRKRGRRRRRRRLKRMLSCHPLWRNFFANNYHDCATKTPPSCV